MIEDYIGLVAGDLLMVPVGGEKWEPNGNTTALWKKRSKTDVCCFVKPPNSQNESLVRKHGAFEIDRKELGSSDKDQTSHMETWIQLSHFSTPRVE